MHLPSYLPARDCFPHAYSPPRENVRANANFFASFLGTQRVELVNYSLNSVFWSVTNFSGVK